MDKRYILLIEFKNCILGRRSMTIFVIMAQSS